MLFYMLMKQKMQLKRPDPEYSRGINDVNMLKNKSKWIGYFVPIP